MAPGRALVRDAAFQSFVPGNQRQDQPERRLVSNDGIQRDIAAVGAGDRSGKGQTRAEPGNRADGVAVASEEWLEEARLYVRGDATGVRDRDFETVVAGASVDAHRRSVFQGVVDEIGGDASQQAL